MDVLKAKVVCRTWAQLYTGLSKRKSLQKDGQMILLGGIVHATACGSLFDVGWLEAHHSVSESEGLTPKM